MARRGRASTADRTAPARWRDGDIDKEAGVIWFANKPHNYLNGRRCVGSAFPRFLALLGSELDCRSRDDDARRELGVSATSLSQYQSADDSQGMALFSLQVVCLKAKMWAREIEFPDAEWATEVDNSLRKIGFRPDRRSSLRARIGEERWLELRRKAEGQGLRNEEAILMARIRQMIITQQLPRDRPFGKLNVADLLDEKPSRTRTALDLLVNEGTLGVDKTTGKYFVATLGSDAIDELLRVRLLIEEMLIHDLLENEVRRKVIVAAMQTKLRTLNSARQNDDLYQFMQNDIDFHATLAAGRMCIEAILRQTLAVVTTAIPTPEKRPETYERICSEHAEILQLIRKGTQESLQKAVICNYNHVMYAFRRASSPNHNGENNRVSASGQPPKARR